MAIVINNTPVDYSSINGDLVFTAYEATKANDPVTYVGYKYVCDVYVGTTLVVRLKANPDPTYKRGVFNIARSVRNYLSQQFNPASAFNVQNFGLNEFYLNVTCKFGEEYGGTLYTNLTVDSTRTYFNHYNGRLTNSDTILTSYQNKLASNSPTTKYVTFGGKCFIPYFSITTGNITVSATYYNTAGTSLGTASASVAVTANQLAIFDIGALGVNALLGGTYTITNAVDKYTITINGYTYTVYLYCEVKYTPYTIHFMNKFGGFESFDFRKVSKKTLSIEKKKFQQQAYRMSSSGAISLRTSNGVVNDTDTTYAVSYKEMMKLNADITTDAQYQWLGELITSPVVYFDDGTLTPVNITDTNYEFCKFINNKITSLSINIDFGKMQNTQFR
jgi:hypothetical protein